MDVSVFITSYNQKEFLREAIESVLSQTHMPDEIIIADDKSKDGSRELIREYEKSHPDLIQPLFQERNVGIPKNKNAAYRATTGDLVTYLDGDDRFRPRKIEVDLETFNANPKADIVCANVAYINPQGRQIGTWCEEEDNVPTGDVATEVLGRDFPTGNLFRNEMVRREVLARVDLMDPGFKMYHDWELRIRLCRAAHLACNDEVTAEYRKNPQGVSSSQAGCHFDEVARVYQKHRYYIETLSPVVREQVNQKLRPWIGQFAWRAFRSAIGRGDRMSAWAYLIDAMKFAPQSIDVRALAQFCLSKSFVDKIRSLRG